MESVLAIHNKLALIDGTTESQPESVRVVSETIMFYAKLEMIHGQMT